MPSKKKKYNSRFPPARIKKIMQTDDEVGKVAAAVPVIISRALELFIESLILKTNETTTAKNAKTLTTSHIKQTIQAEKKFDFLRDLVSSIPDHQTEDDGGENSGAAEPKKPRGPRGPRKPRDGTSARKRTGRKSSSESSEPNANEDDEETETDEEENNGTSAPPTPVMTSPSTSQQLNSPPTAHIPAPHIPPHVQSLPPQMPFNSIPYSMPPMSQVPSMPSVSGMSSSLPQQKIVEDDDYDT
ncbi:dr1-associated corepressor-like [Haliotis rubra]|uniref:dr1-associated corepressor-like n=1 Tax=Haliotis rubra TaxID=36100 RepID=UPI001EE53A56|nr:dr1-associated corepressor-like [Haliotis rubra]